MKKSSFLLVLLSFFFAGNSINAKTGKNSTSSSNYETFVTVSFKNLSTKKVLVQIVRRKKILDEFFINPNSIKKDKSVMVGAGVYANEEFKFVVNAGMNKVSKIIAQ
jgi:hypothetical protein